MSPLHRETISEGDGDAVPPSGPYAQSFFDMWLTMRKQQTQPQIGVSFQDLQCHGFSSSTRYQQTLISYVLAIPNLVKTWLMQRSPQKVQILDDFDGLVRAGEMLLVLGKPGSGCTTFLKTLAGDLHGAYIGKKTKINYQGRSFHHVHTRLKGDSIYLAELDVHFPELELGETLEFAASTRSPHSKPNCSSYDLARDVASTFGLDGSFNTKIGNAMIRGISGGERKRTSIAEAFISGAQFQCWDNSTRGLDSATAQSFVDLLRRFSVSSQATVLMSIYQASEGVYRAFDKVTLLYEGRQIYFGPVDTASDYFIELGFVKPPYATTADFLTSLTDPMEHVIREGYNDRVPKSPDEFAAIWRQSNARKALLSDIDTFDAAYPPGMSKTDTEDYRLDGLCTYPIPMFSQVLICIRRGFLRLRNNYPPVVAGIVGNTIIAIVIGSVFYNLENTTDSLDKRAVLLFFSLTVTAFAPAFEILTMWTQRPIVEKHHRYAFYHPFAESLASVLCDLPNKITVSILFHISLYFLTNLRRDAAAFFIYYLFNILVFLTMSCLFRMIGSVSKTIEQTMAPVSVVVVILIAYTGFVIPVNYMVPWLAWLRWLNPLAYAYESLMINEIANRTFACSNIIPAGPTYSENGMSGKVCSAIGAAPGESFVQGSAYLRLKYNYEQWHLWRNLPILLSMMIVFCIIHLIAAEYIPAQRSKGEVLVFQRRSKKKHSVIENIETGSQRVFSQDDSVPADEHDRSVSSSVPENLSRKGSKVFHWHNLDYVIKTKSGSREILKDVSGWVKPGSITALMGVTGAGKTSLLDVLARRITVGKATGSVYINGKLRDASFQRRMGYVQQDDIHLASSTVREALEFSALLRQPRTSSRREKLAYVDNVLDVLDMRSYANAIVGAPGEGLNIEQRKRLSIAVELVARPEVLIFLDEPTSGLDSQTAWSICMLLRKLADSGQSILCTIHQPSAQLFQLFDRLLLLSQNGETLYFGDIGTEAKTVMDYFECRSASPRKPGENPAEWVLNTTRNPRVVGDSSEKSEHPVVDWPEEWRRSEENSNVVRFLAGLKSSSWDSTPLPREQHSKYAASFFQQLLIVSTRLFQNYWRDPIYLSSKMGLCIGVALANGLSFLNTDLDIQGLTNLIFSSFLLSQLFSTIDQQVIPRLVNGRAIFETRERRSSSYSWAVLLGSNIAAEVFWQTIASVLIFFTWFYPTGLWSHGDTSFGTYERGALAFIIIWLFCLWIITFSQAVAVGIEHEETAVQIATLFFWLSLVFCGVIVKLDQLPGFWKFVYYASPLTYFIKGVLIAGLANTQLTCSTIELLRIRLPSNSISETCSKYLGPYLQLAGGYIEHSDNATDCLYCPADSTNAVLESFGIDIQSRWQNVGFLVVYVVFNILATFGIYWLLRVPKRSAVTV
ncbi:ABC-2 type transporter-domain-containing protein [Xylaria flabelliformis]|nr:ABC-2 type transporter-domain-containing protein [Xylaria flabelliformis]